MLPEAIFVPDTTSDEFEVECIMGTRTSRNKVEYLVRWKGYSPFDDTWEPATGLENAKEAISKFVNLSVRKRRASAV